MNIELKLQALIPDLEMCTGSYIETKIFKKIAEELYAYGRIHLIHDEWLPQHIDQILAKCVEKGYVIEDKSSSGYTKVSIPDFTISEKPYQEDVDVD